MAFFEGSVTYQDIKEMPLSELLKLQEQANEISKERKAQLNNGK